MKKLLLVTILLILIGCGTTYYEKFQQECRQYKVIKKLKSKTSKKVYLKFENGSIYDKKLVVLQFICEKHHKIRLAHDLR